MRMFILIHLVNYQTNHQLYQGYYHSNTCLAFSDGHA